MQTQFLDSLLAGPPQWGLSIDSAPGQNVSAGESDMSFLC